MTVSRYCAALLSPRQLTPALRAQQALDLVDQLPGGKRLGDIKVSTHRHALVDLGIAPLAREHDDLYMRPFRTLADSLADFVAALPRRHVVEQHPVRGVALGGLQPLLHVPS